MKPIIKWPGGKSSEYRYIKDLIPPYERYIEPFFGGGAIFFQEEPQKALINDYNQLLMDFYRLIQKQDESYQAYLWEFVQNWGKIKLWSSMLEGDLKELYLGYRNGFLALKKVKGEIKKLFDKRMKEVYYLFDRGFLEDDSNFFAETRKAITGKIKRMKRLEEKWQEPLPEKDIIENFETALRSGFYTHFRGLLNDYNLGRKTISRGKHLAIFYFVREFCYGSMFRYNKKGEFNIPYGGISYNKKDFEAKVQRLFSPKLKKVFSDVEIYNLDFEDFLDRLQLSINDFVFFDPPYDSDFSTYGGNAFSLADHKRLARVIEEIPARFIMIIKNTGFIDSLYQQRKGIKITSFKKKYSYNVRGRNSRDTKHLIISNF